MGKGLGPGLDAIPVILARIGCEPFDLGSGSRFEALGNAPDASLLDAYLSLLKSAVL
jgi:hypothetical protein